MQENVKKVKNLASEAREDDSVVFDQVCETLIMVQTFDFQFLMTQNVLGCKEP